MDLRLPMNMKDIEFDMEHIRPDTEDIEFDMKHIARSTEPDNP